MPKAQFTVGGLLFTIEGDRKSMRVFNDGDDTGTSQENPGEDTKPETPEEPTTPDETEEDTPQNATKEFEAVKKAISDGLFDQPKTAGQMLQLLNLEDEVLLTDAIRFFIVKKILIADKTRWGHVQYYKAKQ